MLVLFVYEVIADPLSAGSVQPTITFPVPAVAVIPVGASGALAGVTAALAIDAADGTEVEFAVEVVTALKVYSEPFVRPETVQEPLVAAVVTVQVAPVTALPVLS